MSHDLASIQAIVQNQEKNISLMMNMVQRLEDHSNCADAVCAELFRHPVFIEENLKLKGLLKDWERSLES